MGSAGGCVVGVHCSFVPVTVTLLSMFPQAVALPETVIDPAEGEMEYGDDPLHDAPLGPEAFALPAIRTPLAPTIAPPAQTVPDWPVQPVGAYDFTTWDPLLSVMVPLDETTLPQIVTPLSTLIAPDE